MYILQRTIFVRSVPVCIFDISIVDVKYEFCVINVRGDDGKHFQEIFKCEYICANV